MNGIWKICKAKIGDLALYSYYRQALVGALRMRLVSMVSALSIIVIHLGVPSS